MATTGLTAITAGLRQSRVGAARLCQKLARVQAFEEYEIARVEARR